MSSLRYLTHFVTGKARRRKRREEESGERKIDVGGWSINDKRVHESFANILISGDRGGLTKSVFFLMKEQRRGLLANL